MTLYPFKGVLDERCKDCKKSIHVFWRRMRDGKEECNIYSRHLPLSVSWFLCENFGSFRPRNLLFFFCLSFLIVKFANIPGVVCSYLQVHSYFTVTVLINDPNKCLTSLHVAPFVF